MNLPVFQRDASCSLCKLRESAKTVCVGASRLDSNPLDSSTAILVVGENPGIEEDLRGGNFLGQAGRYLRGIYIKYVEERVDSPIHWYGVNAVRCKPIQGADITSTQARKCSGAYLSSDIEALQGAYPKVIVLVTGGPSAQGVLGTGVTEAICRQGQTPVFNGRPVPVFSTYNSAMLMPGRNPSMLHVIRDHLQFLIDYLNTGGLNLDAPVWVRGDLDDPSSYELRPGMEIGLDIETYGCCQNHVLQTVFNPEKATLVDGCDPADRIVSIAAGLWREDGSILTGSWRPDEFHGAANFLRRAIKAGCHILCMNLPFDVPWLRAHPGGLFRRILDRWVMRERGSQLRDLAIDNALYNELRPEKSLKTISPLERVAVYDETTSLKKGHRYHNERDPGLSYYNELDVFATLGSSASIRRKTLAAYPGTAKFGPYCMEWFSDVLWTVVEMNEAGIEFDVQKLTAYRSRVEFSLAKLKDVAAKRYNLPVGGKGSQKPIYEMFLGAVADAGCLDDPRLQRTDKKKTISTGEENRHLLEGLLPIGSPSRLKLLVFNKFKKNEKTLTSYLEPLLDDPRVGLVGGRARPSWFVVPTYQKDNQGSSGGTKQARLTCKEPAIQTNPDSIQACATSRFPGGSLLAGDESQLELRVAALLSNDPLMVADYRAGKDRHTSSAVQIFGANCIHDPDFKKVKRQLGKTLNFLVLFKGGAKKYQETARRDCGLELSLAFCSDAIWKWDAAHPTFRAWQSSLVQQAIRYGRIELPLTGESRLFLGCSRTVRATFITEIANILVQAEAANITKSAERSISDEIQLSGMRSVVCGNIYDSVLVDCPPEEVSAVDSILKKHLRCPPHFQRLCEHLGRTLPLDCDVKVLAYRRDA